MLTAKAWKRPERFPETGDTFRDCPECPEMTVIRAGSFSMGSPETEQGRYDNEGPAHLVSVPTFAIGKYELTFDEWDACVVDNGCKHLPVRNQTDRGRYPVADVSWADAKSYISWLGRRTGKRYRLPSEAEWEFAARAGTKGSFPFEIPKGPWSYRNEIGPGLAHVDAAWSAVVGSYPQNRWGLHDMIGNVSEWVEDCWHGSYDRAPSDGSAWVGKNCYHRVVRGDSWKNSAGTWVSPSNFRSAKRSWGSPSTRFNETGFRVVTDIN